MSHEPNKPTPEAQATPDEAVEPAEMKAVAPETGIMNASANGTGTIRVTN
jgi:hypothetical protein